MNSPSPGTPAAYPAGGASLPDPLHHLGRSVHSEVPHSTFVATTRLPTTTSPFTLERHQRFFVSTSTVFQDSSSQECGPTYLFWRSLKLAIIYTLVCLVLAIPGLSGPEPSPLHLKRCSSPSS